MPVEKAFRSAEQRADLRERERLERKIDAVADDAREQGHLRVDVAHGDHDGLVAAQRGGVDALLSGFFQNVERQRGRVDDRGHADGVDRHADGLFLQRAAVIADAAARHDAGIGELDGGAETRERARGQRVDDDERVGLHGPHRAAHDFERLDTRAAQHAGCEHADGGERGEDGVLAQVPRDEHVPGRKGTDGVGRHGRVAEPRDQYAVDAAAEQQPELRAHGARRAFERVVCVFEKRGKVERHVPSAGLAERAGGLLALHGDACDAAAAAKDGAAVHPREPPCFLSASPEFVRFHGEVRAPNEHKRSPSLTKSCFPFLFLPQSFVSFKKIRKIQKNACNFLHSLLKYHSARWIFCPSERIPTGGGVWFAEYQVCQEARSRVWCA